MKNCLSEFRQLRQWSQADMARELGVSRQAVNGFESGKFTPSLDMALKIAELLGVAVEDIFIPEAKSSMQTLLEQVKNFFGFELGFERFTEESIQAIQYAQREAARSHSPQVEPEHLLDGLLANPHTTSARILEANGFSSARKVFGDTPGTPTSLKLNAQSKFVLELSLQIVRLQGKKTIGTEHLLWGLIQLVKTNKTNLKEIFQQNKVNLEALTDQLLEFV